MRWIVAAFAVGLIIAGCNVNPSEISSNMASRLAAKITYTQDTRTGLCFAVVASRKTMDANQTGLGITQVDCEMCEHLVAGGVRPAPVKNVTAEIIE